jgi:D-threo-aldose 1-dehydrogenase
MNYNELGKTDIKVPPIIFGTSCLGNLYQALPAKTKLAIVKEMFRHVDPPVALDSAGKYGAGLALEVIGRSLQELGIRSEDVVISNKLGWKRVPLRTPAPTFEPGAWVDLEYDAEQDISYDGILRCWEQGCELLGENYWPQVVSVHDPDEYLAQSTSENDRAKRFEDIVGVYRALAELKQQGHVKAVGVGAKDWPVIRELSQEAVKSQAWSPKPIGRRGNSTTSGRISILYSMPLAPTVSCLAPTGRCVRWRLRMNKLSIL